MRPLFSQSARRVTAVFEALEVDENNDEVTTVIVEPPPPPEFYVGFEWCGYGC